MPQLVTITIPSIDGNLSNLSSIGSISGNQAHFWPFCQIPELNTRMGGAASSARNVERFKIVDSDENASVTVAELKALLSAEWTEERIKKLIAVFDDDGNLIKSMNAEQVRQFVKKGTISSGMLPKVESALEAVSAGVHNVQIIDGTIEHALLLELFTDEGVGTMIRRT